MDSSSEYCRKNVRDGAYDLYLISLLTGRGPDLWAVFAFACEIAKTRQVVSEPALGLIRLQWWRDEIGKIYAGDAHAPGEVLDALAGVIKRYDLPHDVFEALLAARAVELEQDVPRDFDAAIGFIQSLNVPLLTLAAMMCGEDVASEPVEAIAMNYGIVDVLRRARKESFVGREIDVFREAFAGGVKSDNRLLKSVQASAELRFKHMKACGFSMENPRFYADPALYPLRLWTKTLF
jgi:phytoene synthase